MIEGTPMSRSPVFFSVLLLASLWFPSPVMAKSIKMLPPEQSNMSDTPCEEGEGDKILTWNGESALKCNKDVIIDKNGKVGIGTTSPKAKLSVNGGVQANNDSDTCVAAKAGTIRWNGSAFQGCNGTAWVSFAVLPTCPTGSVLATNETGNPSCKRLVCRYVDNIGGAPTYTSHATCNNDEILTGGGGYAETPGSLLCAGIKKGFVHHSMPNGNKWSVDAYNNDWVGEACSFARAICCKFAD